MRCKTVMVFFARPKLPLGLPPDNQVSDLHINQWGDNIN